MKAFVTGASGCVGQVVCAELLARGHEVTARVRRPGSEPAPRFPSATQGVPDAVAHT
ncbi:MAG TPA: NAD-dependent epimerase/dehydratase family protein [Solirubrobacteraceae bacterium]|nr:NAD-dependent epimerase/dehydratase family protein [Solirubrobacteraceae bacterium]